MPKDRFERLIETCSTYTEVLKHFTLDSKGGNIATLKRRIAEEGHSVRHFKDGAAKAMLQASLSRRKPLSDLLVLWPKSVTCPGNFKLRLVEEGVLRKECYECGLTPTWNHKVLVLALDHIDGNPLNNKRENLRFLCPNCHSQTPTFAGRNSAIAKQNRKSRVCKDCGLRIVKGSTRCRVCSAVETHKASCLRPPREVLEAKVWAQPCTKVASDLGVTDASVADWCKHYGIAKPPRGYWQKLRTLPN